MSDRVVARTSEISPPDSQAVRQHVAITGASRGLGAALALRYAAPGIKLTLIARDAVRLAATAEAASRKGAVVTCVVADVRADAVLSTALEAADREMPINLLIANAGVGGARSMAGADGEAPDVAREVAAVNFLGVVNAVAPLVGPMVKRRSGHIVIVSSMAAMGPVPLAPTYAGSKAGISSYAHNLRLLLRPKGVHVTLVSPGFVDTDMSADIGPRPFLVTADDLAGAIQSAVTRRARHLVYPWQLGIAVAIARLLPDWVIRAAMRHWERSA